MPNPTTDQPEATPAARPPFDAGRWANQRETLASVLEDLRRAVSRDIGVYDADEWIEGAVSAYHELAPDWSDETARREMWQFYLRFTSPEALSGFSHGGRLSRCGECGREDLRAFMCYAADADNYYCASCASNYAWRSDWDHRSCQWYEPEPDNDFFDEEAPSPQPLRRPALHNYSASPIDRIGLSWLSVGSEVVTPTTRLFGCEIEFQCDEHEQLVAVTNEIAQNIGIYKSDGSLASLPGAEFCTLPMTRAAIPMLEPVLKRMIELGARAWNRPDCGLHVHVSRNSASWSTWGKVERFFQNARNQAFLDKVAGRAPNTFCRRGQRGQISVKQAMLKNRGVGGGHGHYDALCLATGHKPTVEFRLFRGNVAYHGVVRAIQFCDSLVDYASEQSNTNRMDYTGYVEWLGRHAKAFPQLRRLLTNKDTGEVATERKGRHELVTIETAL